MNVLSLFDGMSCGQIALNKIGIKYDNYFAAEIKDHAIKVTQDNYPNTIQIGNVLNVRYNDGVLSTENGDFKTKIDLFIGGSPCQNFSQANRVRDGLEGAKSGLFWEYVRILKECKPKYFLLENVKMKKEDEDIISETLGFKPININSKLLSGQLRNRFYWTNIPGITQPEDKGIKLQSILEDGYTNKEKSRCLLESDSRPLTTPKEITVGETDIYDGVRYPSQLEMERLQTVPEGYTSIVNRNDAACLLGDGWTVDVIAHIFKNLKEEL